MLASTRPQAVRREIRILPPKGTASSGDRAGSSGSLGKPLPKRKVLYALPSLDVKPLLADVRVASHLWQTSKVTPPGKVRDANRPANLKIIAEHLGLSVAAISRVLNGAPAAKS